MKYSLFFYKGNKKDGIAPLIVPIYQFLFSPECGEMVGIAYHTIENKMMQLQLDEVIPAPALEYDSDVVKSALSDWNAAHKDLMLVAYPVVDADCSFNIKVKEHSCSKNSSLRA